jgi:hypothetical protein
MVGKNISQWPYYTMPKPKSFHREAYKRWGNSIQTAVGIEHSQEMLEAFENNAGM